MTKFWIFVAAVVLSLISTSSTENVNYGDLDPNDARQLIEGQDQTLKYAPKIESNVPALRFLGKEQHQVLEDIYLANQYHGQDGLGGYLYGYSVPDIAKTEKKVAGGDLRGAYNYVNGDGQEIKVQYWDDGTGFHQVDNVADFQPQQVEDTPEVKAAKEEHLRIWQEQAERNSHAPADPNANYDAHSINQQNTYAQQGAASNPFFQSSSRAGTPQYGIQAQGQYNQYSSPKPFVQGQTSSFVPQGGSFTAKQPQVPIAPVPSNIPNYLDYSGSSSEKRQVYATNPQAQARQPQQKSEEEEEEPTGPPRGFFYSFDYPVGIIVQKQGLVQKREDLNNIYSQNKAEFEQQLKNHGDYRPTRAAAGYPNYFYVAA